MTKDQKITEEKLEKEEELVPQNISAEDLATLQDMMKAGLMYGHKKSKTNPKFKQYIFTTRNGIEVIDLAQTLGAIDSAVEFLASKIKNSALILVVATQPAAKEAVMELTGKFGFSYINERWIGGLLTNFRNLSQRIENWKRTKADFEKGNFEKYTKKERVVIARDVARMDRMFTGLENLTRLPDVLFVIDSSIKSHETAMREASQLNIPIVGIVDSDDNPEKFNYAIPANDHAKLGLDWLVKKISSGLEAKK